MYCDFPDFGKCCFCFPLRKGLLTFAYIAVFVNIIMIWVDSYVIHTGYEAASWLAGSGILLPTELCLAMACMELIVTVLLIYGIHKNITSFIKVCYYYTIMSMVATILLQTIDVVIVIYNNNSRFHIIFEFVPIMCALTFAEIYVLVLIRSLIRRIDATSAPNVYDNPLQQFVYDGKVESNGVYDPTVEPVEV